MTKLDMKIDLEGLAALLQARTNQADLDPDLIKLLNASAAAHIQAYSLLVTFPGILENKRASTVVETGARIAASMITVADQYDSGDLAITTPGNAVRSFAASLAKAVMTPDEEKGRAKKPKLIGLN